MKKISLWLLLALSFWTTGVQTMEQAAKTITMNEDVLEKLIESATHKGALQAISDSQESTLWHYSKKGLWYGGIAIGVYFGVRKILGMPSMAHVKKVVDGHVETAKKYIGDVFGGISTSLTDLKTRVTQLCATTQDTTTMLNDVASIFSNRDSDLSAITGQVDQLVAFAKNLEDEDSKMNLALIGLITAICSKPDVKNAILKHIENKLKNDTLENENRETLLSLQQKIVNITNAA